MAHYAEIDDNSIVIKVVVVDDIDEGGSEAKGVVYLKGVFGEDTDWKKTSYNTVANSHREGGKPFRKNYAGIGFYYDKAKNAFIAEQPYPSWELDKTTCTWKAPTIKPNDGDSYSWDEASTTWIVCETV
jgi:hypothetical protein